MTAKTTNSRMSRNRKRSPLFTLHDPLTPAHSSMHLTLAQGYSVTTMLAVAAVAILLTGAFYRRAFWPADRPGNGDRSCCLRLAAILLVVMLLFRPV